MDIHRRLALAALLVACGGSRPGPGDGGMRDASPRDASRAEDASPDEDAGAPTIRDAGSDGGTDAGMDAGPPARCVTRWVETLPDGARSTPELRATTAGAVAYWFDRDDRLRGAALGVDGPDEAWTSTLRTDFPPRSQGYVHADPAAAWVAFNSAGLASGSVDGGGAVLTGPTSLGDPAVPAAGPRIVRTAAGLVALWSSHATGGARTLAVRLDETGAPATAPNELPIAWPSDVVAIGADILAVQVSSGDATLYRTALDGSEGTTLAIPGASVGAVDIEPTSDGAFVLVAPSEGSGSRILRAEVSAELSVDRAWAQLASVRGASLSAAVASHEGQELVAWADTDFSSRRMTLKVALVEAGAIAEPVTEVATGDLSRSGFGEPVSVAPLGGSRWSVAWLADLTGSSPVRARAAVVSCEE